MDFRIIASLCLKDGCLVNTTRYSNEQYIGNPINAAKIFSDKDADEILVLDISSGREKKINYNLLEKIANQSFSPLGYGGLIRNKDQVNKLFSIGFERLYFRTAVFENLELIDHTSNKYGVQSVGISIDCVKEKNTYFVEDKKSGGEHINIIDFLEKIQTIPCGEILLNSVDRDGSKKGPDLNLLKIVKPFISCSLVYSGGVRNFDDFYRLRETGADGVSCSTFLVTVGEKRGVVISYPSKDSFPRSL